MKKQQYYECGICDNYHYIEFNGDCRDDDERFQLDEIPLDAEIISWEEMQSREATL